RGRRGGALAPGPVTVGGRGAGRGPGPAARTRGPAASAPGGRRASAGSRPRRGFAGRRSVPAGGGAAPGRRGGSRPAAARGRPRRRLVGPVAPGPTSADLGTGGEGARRQCTGKGRAASRPPAAPAAHQLHTPSLASPARSPWKQELSHVCQASP